MVLSDPSGNLCCSDPSIDKGWRGGTLIDSKAEYITGSEEGRKRQSLKIEKNVSVILFSAPSSLSTEFYSKNWALIKSKLKIIENVLYTRQSRSKIFGVFIPLEGILEHKEISKECLCY